MSSKVVSWGTVTFDTENSDSGVGSTSGILEKEFKSNLDASEKVTVKIAVGLWGRSIQIPEVARLKKILTPQKRIVL